MTIEELYTILLSEKPSIILKTNEEELFKLIPELEMCKGFNQNNKWHIYDVYEHILHVVDNVPGDLVLRLSALFHDMGKPLSYTEDENKVGHFYGHWEISKKIFDSFSLRYNLNEKLSEDVSNLIYYHDINISKLDKEDLDLVINKLGIEGINNLYELKKADLLAQNKKYHYILDEYDEQKERIFLSLKKR